MLIPSEITDFLDHYSEKMKLSDLAEASLNLSERYRTADRNGLPLVLNETEAAAYALSRMPATFGAVRTALTRSLQRFTGPEIKTVLDVGAGTGAASFAAEDLLNIEKVHCLERDERMSGIGRTIFSETAGILKNAVWEGFDIVKDKLDDHADLVLCSYVLNELKETDLRAAVLKLWHAADGLLLIAEPGTPAGWRLSMTIRDILLSEGAHIIAPCLHEKPCPLPENDWCHFTCRIPRSRIHKQLKLGDAPYEDEKFMFIAASKTPVAEGTGGRVLRHPVIGKNRIEAVLCTEAASIVRTSYIKKDGDVFKAAKKADPGDLLELPKRDSDQE